MAVAPQQIPFRVKLKFAFWMLSGLLVGLFFGAIFLSELSSRLPLIDGSYVAHERYGSVVGPIYEIRNTCTYKRKTSRIEPCTANGLRLSKTYHMTLALSGSNEVVRVFVASSQSRLNALQQELSLHMRATYKAQYLKQWDSFARISPPFGTHQLVALYRVGPDGSLTQLISPLEVASYDWGILILLGFFSILLLAGTPFVAYRFIQGKIPPHLLQK